MEISEVKSLLWQIGKIYPTLGGLLMKVVADKSLGERWAEILCDLESDILEDVCGEYADLKHKLPEPLDQLVFEIQQECKNRQAVRYAKWMQHEKYHSRGRAPWREGKHVNARWCHAVRYCLDHKATADQVEELIAWDKGGPEPAWLSQSAT